MSLTKNDLKQIRTVVKEEDGQSEKRFDDKLGGLEKILSKKIEDKVEGLATMTKSEFDISAKSHE